MESEFITARELNLAVTFLSEKIDTGFKVTHDKQDYTNGRLLRAEDAIKALQQTKAVDRAIERAADVARTRVETWKVTALATGGTSALGAIGWLLQRVFG